MAVSARYGARRLAAAGTEIQRGGCSRAQHVDQLLATAMAGHHVQSGVSSFRCKRWVGARLKQQPSHFHVVTRFLHTNCRKRREACVVGDVGISEGLVEQ